MIDLFQMNSNVIIILSITITLLFISSCESMNMFTSNDDRFDVFHHEPNSGNVTSIMVKRHSHRRCVRCKLGLFKCCEPDICVKKTLRPDKCLSIKQG
jgi:hypothetical protein